MSRADVIALAQTLGTEVDAVLLDRYYDEGLISIGDTDVSVRLTLIPVTNGVARYAIEAAHPATVRIRAAFFGSRELTRTNLIALGAVALTWSTATGTPRNYIEEHEDHLFINLHPAPNATSAAWSPVNGEPFGADYPTDQLIVLTSDAEDPPMWLDLPLALSILARDLAHASSRTDPAVVQACLALGAACRAIGGLP